MEIRDLTGFAYIRETGVGHCSAQAPDGGVYYVYTDETQAIAEVTYCRLSELLALPCAQATYGTNFRGSGKFVSASSYSPNWISYQTWKNRQHLLTQIKNPQDRSAHIFLNVLTQQMFIYTNEGFVTRDGYYIKTNNGGAFFSRTLAYKTKRNSEMIRITPCSFDAFVDLTKGHEDGYRILQKIAEISDEEINSCVEMPEWKHKSIATDYFTGKLVLAKEMAQVYLRAVKKRAE